MLEGNYFPGHLALAVLAFLLDGACGLSLPAAFALIFGRKGHAAFCASGSRSLLFLSLCAGISGIVYYPLSCFMVLAPYGNMGPPSFLQSLFSPGGMPWFSAWLVWLAGLALLLAAFYQCGRLKIGAMADSFRMAQIRLPFYLALGGSLCFFSSFFLINWPFGGMPPELSTQRVLLAVGRNAFRHWFFAFAAGGAIALAFAPYCLSRINCDKIEKMNAARYCAMWAACGAIPACFTNWGLILGLLLRNGVLPQIQAGMHIQLLGLFCLTFAIACWLFCFWKKRAGLIAWLGLFFLFLRALAPLLRSLG